MGEAKKRKLSDPNYGKDNQVARLRGTRVSKEDILGYIEHNEQLYKDRPLYNPDFGLYFYLNFNLAPILLFKENLKNMMRAKPEGYIPFHANFMDGIVRLGTVIVPKRDFQRITMKVETQKKFIVLPDVNDIIRDENGAYYLPFKPIIADVDIDEYCKMYDFPTQFCLNI